MKVLLLMVGFFVAVSSGFAADPPVPSPSDVGPSNRISEAEGRMLGLQFVGAQLSEIQATEHRHQLELQELRRSQESRRKSWASDEAKKKELFFSMHKDPQSRRRYMQDEERRGREIDQSLALELDRRKREQKAFLDRMRSDHAKSLKAFKDLISQGKRPPEDLWPK